MKAFWVTKRLAFGSAITTWRHVEQLKAVGVTHVVNLRHGKHGRKVKQFKNLWLPFRDDMKPRPKWFYRRALRFCSVAFREPNCKIFVMCHHGTCRSPSLAYFLLRACGHEPEEAIALVRKARRTARIVRAYRYSCEKFLWREDIGQ
jgi:protein-tyrosine phosphatase